jgi:flagellar M-ring protein FliF
VLVPEERVHELRLQLAGQGLPRGGGIGFELFDKSHFGATEFEQRINLRRALEGELARTIGTLASVQAARVHLVLPERSVFAVNKEEASASVVLRLRSGRAFGRPEVAAVVHLVSSAVPGLAADRVSIVSAEGLTLHRPRSDAQRGGPGGVDEDVAERESAVAASMEEQVRALLERVVGAGKADVRIHVALDTAARERTEEHYEPAKTALRSEQKTEEKSGAEGASVAGVPGALSNLPDTGEEPAEGEAGGATSRSSWTRNWEVDRVTEKTVIPAGRVARLSVAVLVDGVYKESGGGAAYVPRDAAELARLGDLVKGAVGFDAVRGDSLQIDSAQFAKVAEPAAAGGKELIRAKRPWWHYAVAGAALLVALSAVVLVWRRRARAPAARTVAALPAGEPAPAEIPGAAVPRGLPGAPAVPRADSRALRENALSLAARDPATAAVILREWLSAPSAISAAPARF